MVFFGRASPISSYRRGGIRWGLYCFRLEGTFPIPFAIDSTTTFIGVTLFVTGDTDSTCLNVHVVVLPFLRLFCSEAARAIQPFVFKWEKGISGVVTCWGGNSYSVLWLSASWPRPVIQRKYYLFGGGILLSPKMVTHLLFILRLDLIR